MAFPHQNIYEKYNISLKHLFYTKLLLKRELNVKIIFMINYDIKSCFCYKYILFFLLYELKQKLNVNKANRGIFFFCLLNTFEIKGTIFKISRKINKKQWKKKVFNKKYFLNQKHFVSKYMQSLTMYKLKSIFRNVYLYYEQELNFLS